MPRGLGGNTPPNKGSEAMVLLEASCEACREATRKFEDKCLNDMFGHGRARLNMNRKDRRQVARRATVRYRDGRTEDRDLDTSHVPAAMVIPHFPTAALFLGLDWRPKPVEVFQTVVDDDSRVRDPSIEQIVVTLDCDFVSFARMLSKIALGVAHYALGPDAFHAVARDFIRSGSGHPNHYVGGFMDRKAELPTPPIGGFHNIGLLHYQTFLVATIQLFADIKGSPVNYAIVGPLRRVPPGLPHLHLGAPKQHRDKNHDQPATASPMTVIQWDQVIP
jgi:hypothetical protein